MSFAVASNYVSLHTAFPYVAAAYIVVLAVILIYVAIMAKRLLRSQRELAQLRSEYEAREAASPDPLSDPALTDRESEPVA